MLRYFIQKSCGKSRFRKPRISVCVPSGVTEVEKKAVEDATYEAGAREVAKMCIRDSSSIVCKGIRYS